MHPLLLSTIALAPRPLLAYTGRQASARLYRPLGAEEACFTDRLRRSSNSMPHQECRLKSVLCTVVAFLLVIPVKPALSAEIELVDAYHARCHVVLSGTIVEGDAERLREILPGSSEGGTYRHFIYDGPTLCLNSPGGSFVEGLAIARYLGKIGVRTHIAAFDECLSACAMAFLGGTHYSLEDRLNDGRSRSMHATARLGFHGPSLRVDDGSFSRAVVEEAFEVAIHATARIFTRLDELRISNDFALSFIKVPRDVFFEIDTPNRVLALGVDVVGLGKLPVRLSDERMRDICHSVMPQTNPKNPAAPVNKYGSYRYLGSWTLELPSSQDGEYVRQAFLVAADQERIPFWHGCSFSWRAEATETKVGRLYVTLLRRSDMIQSDRENYRNVKPPSPEHLSRQLREADLQSKRLPPSLVSPPGTKLKELAKPAALRRRQMAASICGPDQRIYSVHDVNSFATLRAAPGFDKQVIAEVPLDAPVTPVLDVPDNTRILSDQCLSACTLSRLPAVTPEALRRIDQCRRSSNEIWWKVATEDGQNGWMSSKFLADFTNGPF